MITVHEIEDAIRNLQDEDLALLRAWFAEFDAAAWDRQFERDVAQGRLDSLAEEALLDAREGRCTDRMSAENATRQDIEYEVYVRHAIEAGLKDSQEGRVVPLTEARRRFGLKPE